jgi:hypothetical protein
LLVAVLAGFALLPLAHSQGRGVVEGRLVNGTDASKIPANVEIDVVGLGGGMSVLKSTVSDASGNFRIEGLPTDSPLMIRANYASVNYHGRISFDSSGKAKVQVEIFEPTTSMKGVTLEGIRMAFQLTGDHLRSLESHTFRNETKPPRTYMNMDGNFRFSKTPGISEPPKLSVTGPGSAMPLVQSPLESSDGESYYSLYALRPGVTSFEVEQNLHYENGTYTYRKKFFHDAASFQIGVIPQDMKLEGEGLAKIQTDTQRNFAVYSGGPVEAGTEVVWTFSGGTPVEPERPAGGGGESKIEPMATTVGRNALIIGPLLLMGFIVVLWYAFNRIQSNPSGTQDSRSRELKERREQLLNFLATLDGRYEAQSMDRREYVRLRESGKRQLRRVAMLLGKKAS